MGAFLPKLGLAAIAALAISGTANAAVTISNYTAGQLAAPAGQIVVDSFDSASTNGYSMTGGDIRTGSVTNDYQSPAGDSSAYLAVEGGQLATLTTPTTATAFSLYVGSIDNFNAINFYTGSNVLVSSFTGTQLRTYAGGSSSVGVADGRFSFDLTGLGIDKITFGSTNNAFEIDNISAAIPEPGVWAMMMLGLGGLGYALRRRRYAVRGAATA
jgi:hypothetical protein